MRRSDRVLAAYVCQRRATELVPGDPDGWYALAEPAHITGRRDEARAAYERYRQSHPDDVEIQHLLVALRDEQPPDRAPDHYIKYLYSYFADFYDDNMRGDLDYRAPELLNAALVAAVGERTDLTVLDLGCGTGLFGELFRPRSRRLIGIDLSVEMIERASRRTVINAGDPNRLYDHLEVAEITAWLADQRPRPQTGVPAESSRFDVVAACDTLIYFGDLRQVIPAAARHLAPGGVLGFTVEQGEEFPFRLGDSGRFAHHRDHLLEVGTGRAAGGEPNRGSAPL
ncbi:MAG TPA: methyltransferase domain-containing protein [Pirellulales bacterium]|nr:methyltransferase domain-containing protein [Pirellulales bacterium]